MDENIYTNPDCCNEITMQGCLAKRLLHELINFHWCSPIISNSSVSYKQGINAACRQIKPVKRYGYINENYKISNSNHKS